MHEDVPEDDEEVQDEDVQEGVENKDVQGEEDMEDGTPALHVIDCIVQGEQRVDGNVVLSCTEAALRVLRQRFTHVAKIIMQVKMPRILLASKLSCSCLMCAQLLGSSYWCTATMRHVGLMWNNHHDCLYKNVTGRDRDRVNWIIHLLVAIKR